MENLTNEEKTLVINLLGKLIQSVEWDQSVERWIDNGNFVFAATNDDMLKLVLAKAKIEETL